MLKKLEKVKICSKLNYVTKDEYASKTEADAVSGATQDIKSKKLQKKIIS